MGGISDPYFIVLLLMVLVVVLLVLLVVIAIDHGHRRHVGLEQSFEIVLHDDEVVERRREGRGGEGRGGGGRGGGEGKGGGQVV